MNYAAKATQLHESGCNCCQAVLMSCCEKLGLAQEQAYHLAAFFGAGMRNGEVCGAASGALMALGLQYGDENNRQCGKSREFLDAFRKEHGTLLCRDILAQHQKKICPALIQFAAQYLEDEFA